MALDDFKLKIVANTPTCLPATVENDVTTPTYSDTVGSGDTLILPTQTIEVNSVNEGSINSVGTIEIETVDSNSDPVAPLSVDITGRKVKIEVPSGAPSFDPDAMVWLIDTKIASTITNTNQFGISTIFTGNNFDVKTSDGQTFTNQTSGFVITFPSEGQYFIEIKGTITFSYGTGGGTHPLDRGKLLQVIQWGQCNVGLHRSFEACPNVQIIATDIPNIIDFSGFTNNARVPISEAIKDWDVSTFTNFSGAFRNNPAFNSPLTNWDTSNGVTFGGVNGGTFSGASSFNQPVNHFNVSGGTSLQNMFSGASRFNQALDNWDVSNISSFASVFDAASVFNQDISMWDVSAGTNFSSMFFNAAAFNRYLGNWQLNPSGITTMTQMFRNSGMSTANYTDTLVAWANQVFDNGGNPASVNFTNQQGNTFDTSRSGGANFVDAGAARTYLTTTAGWSITGDTVI